jgi:hypothetical protein
MLLLYEREGDEFLMDDIWVHNFEPANKKQTNTVTMFRQQSHDHCFLRCKWESHHHTTIGPVDPFRDN